MKDLITIPTYDEIKGINPALTDYAVDTGALSVPYHDGINVVNRGEIWLRNLGPDFTRMQTYFSDGTSHCVSHDSSNPSLGVMPRFRRKNYIFSSSYQNEEDVLKINGEVVKYPQTRVRGVLAAKLSLARDRADQQLKNVGAFTRSNDTMELCYHYQGHNYVNVQMLDADNQLCDRWYLCEPIQVYDDMDGTIQSRKILFAAPFENRIEKLNTLYGNEPGTAVAIDSFRLGEFLNQNFLHDLVLSTAFDQNVVAEKLSHCQSFCENSLRVNFRGWSRYPNRYK